MRRDNNANEHPDKSTVSGHSPYAQVMLFAYAVCAVLTTALLWFDPNSGSFQDTSAIVFVATGLVSLVIGLLLIRSGSRPGRALRRSIIGFELLLIPLQAVLSVLSLVIWVGLVLSIVILALMRPTFPKLSRPWRKLFLTLHVGLAVSWLGVSMAMVVLSVTGLLTEDPELRHNAYAFMHIFDLAIVIPLVVVSIVTGLVVSLGTHWGLIKNWWVLTKFAIALSIPIFAGVKENFWVRELAEKTAADPGADLGGVDLKLAVCMVAFCAALWTATVLSIYKPWGRTRWGERQRANDIATAKAARTEDRVTSPKTTAPSQRGATGAGRFIGSGEDAG
ncbi:MAG: hypothetical protein M3360_06605 [Actinomycetota bacterium]|nr:hypothetical protein [Actinomycetota bacterium]